MTESKIARVLSYLLHPLLIPTYILALLLNIRSFMAMSLPMAFQLTLIGVVVLTTILMPLFLCWLLLRIGILSSIYMNTREERTYPLLAISVFYYLTYFILRGIHISSIFSFYMLGATLLAVMALLLNFSRKISLHTIAAGSTTGLFLGLSLRFGVDLNMEILSSILIAGLIGYARLKSNSHQPAEVYSGFLMGVVVITGLMFLL